MKIGSIKTTHTLVRFKTYNGMSKYIRQYSKELARNYPSYKYDVSFDEHIYSIRVRLKRFEEDEE